MTGRGRSSRRRPEVPGKSRQDTDANNHGVRPRHPTVRRDCARLVRLCIEHRPRSVQTTRALFIPGCSGPASANRYGNRYGRGFAKSFGLATSATEFAHASLARAKSRSGSSRSSPARRRSGGLRSLRFRPVCGRRRAFHCRQTRRVVRAEHPFLLRAVFFSISILFSGCAYLSRA
jgi:hypothetical protein